MGSENHVVVVDVSSDEEVDRRVHVDYFNWLNDVMEAVDENSDSTDLVEVLSEVKGSIDSQYRKPNSSIQAVDDDDDDCVILDGDPDKTASIAVVEDADKFSKNDDDDVVVVGQKGEIACRDFPHPRHACAKFSFNSTSHEKYCDMCHCYVCDIRAPCQYWCIGVSSIDHCHATDKEKIWKNQRENFRTGNMPIQPSSKPTTPLPASSTVTRPAQSIIRLSQNTLPQNQVGIRPCASSTRVGDLSNSRARYRVKQSIPHNENHGLQNRQVQSLSSVRKNVIRKDRDSYTGNVRSRVASSGARYGASNGNIKAGLHTNAQLPQSNNHSTSIVAPMIHQGMYTQQQRSYQSIVTDNLVSQSNVYTRHSGQNKNGSGNCKLQANADLFSLPETPLGSAVSQAQTVQQRPGTNENVLHTKLYEVESWLMDSSNQTGPVSMLPEPVSLDYVNSLTFDFETFLND